MLTLNRSNSGQSAKAATVAPEDAPNSEEDFEDHLIALLGQLDYLREGMLAARDGGRTPQVLEQALQFMRLIAEFCELRCPFSTGREMDDAIIRTKQFFATISNLDIPSQGGSSKSRFGAAGKNGSAVVAVENSPAHACFAAMHDAVSAYFIVFTNRFPTSRSACAWVDVAATFLVELKQLTSNPIVSA